MMLQSTYINQLGMNYVYGKYHQENATWKLNPQDPYNRYVNSITRRNRELVEMIPTKQPSTSLASAALKSLRFYRHICRMIPYLIKIHQITHRTTPEQAKIYMANHFRANAHLTDIAEIDLKLELGYEMLHDAEWHLAQTGYLYKFLVSPKYIYNDHGIDRFDDYRAEKLNRKSETTPFLKKFYKGYKSYEI